MLTKTEAYRALEQAGYNHLVYVHVSTDVTRRIFTFKESAGVTEGSGFWDGSRWVGDGMTYGYFAGISEVKPLLLSLSAIKKESTQSTRNLYSSLSASSVGSVTVTLDNTELYFTDIVSGEMSERFEGYSLEVRVGFEGLGISDQLSLFKGTIIDTEINAKSFTLSADAVSSTLYDTWEVPKTSRYSSPANTNSALPVIIGDMTENSAGGAVVCPCINTGAFVYALACHPILSVANGNTFSLYDADGDLISSSNYSVTTSGDYEGTGLTIAYATFTSSPGNTVTGKYKGAVDSTGALITNPVACIDKLLEIMGDSTEFETTSYIDAYTTASNEGYTCAGYIISDNTKAYWLSRVLASFMGSWFISEDDKLSIYFDASSDNLLSAAGDLRQGESSAVSRKTTRDNIITRTIINYAVSGAEIDKRYKSDAKTAYYKTYSPEEATDDITQEFSFDWTRNTATVESLSQRITNLYGEPLAIYSWKEQGLENIHVEPGDLVAFEWDYILDDTGAYLQGELGRVLNITKDVVKQNISLTFYDTRRFLLALPYRWDGTLYVGQGLTFGGERRTA